MSLPLCLSPSPTHMYIYIYTKTHTLYTHRCIWLLAQLLSRLRICEPMDCSPPGSSVHGISQARILEWVAHAFLQGIFLTQGSNSGLLHRRQMPYHLSHQGNPKESLAVFKIITMKKIFQRKTEIPEAKRNDPKI